MGWLNAKIKEKEPIPSTGDYVQVTDKNGSVIYGYLGHINKFTSRARLRTSSDDIIINIKNAIVWDGY